MPVATLKFLMAAAQSPAAVGAIAPSSSALGRKIAAAVLEVAGTGPVVEIGAGEGAVTRQLLAAGIPAHRLTTLELDAGLHARLSARTPGPRHVLGDARALPEVLGDIRPSVVVSCLPMLSIPVEPRRAILRALENTLANGGFVVQFTYAPRRAPLLVDDLPTPGRWTAQRVGGVFFNLPPAQVWRYSLTPAA